MENENTVECSCPKTSCSNHRKCDVCVARHRAGGSLPYCLRDCVRKEHKKSSVIDQ